MLWGDLKQAVYVRKSVWLNLKNSAKKTWLKFLQSERHLSQKP